MSLSAFKRSPRRKASPRQPKQHATPPTPIHFSILTKAYLDSKEDEKPEKTEDEIVDEELQMHDILKKWQAGDKSTTTTPSKVVSEVVKEEPNPKLESGCKLPNRVKIDDSLLGVPLEDVDPYYRKSRSTFIVIGRDRNLTRFAATDALFLFSPFNPLRRASLYILVHPIFSLLVILTILCNCVFMAMTAPPEVAEYVFTAVYTLEALIKVTARGFFLAPFTYIRDAWNILDFVVITLAYVTSFVNLGNLSILRTFRVLRALKTVAIVPGLKTIVGALLEAVRRLRDVAVLTLFMLSIFALIGLQLYMGQLGHKCVRRMPTLNETTAWESEVQLGVTLSTHRKMDPLIYTGSESSTVVPSDPLDDVNFITTLLKRKRRSVLISYVNYNFTSFAQDESEDFTETHHAARLVSLTGDKEHPVIPKEPVFVTDIEPHPNSTFEIINTLHNVQTDDDVDEWLHSPENWLVDPEGRYVVCGAGKCPNGYVCVNHIGDNPDFGFTSFDNYGWAMFAGFRLMTQDAWERLFHQVIAASGTYHVIYFMLVIFLGSFYLINLILAIVAMSYQDLQILEEEAAAQEREDEKAERDMIAANERAVESAMLAIEMETPHHTITSTIIDPEANSPETLVPDNAPDLHAALERQPSTARREEFAERNCKSFEIGSPQGSAKPARRRTLERQTYSVSRRSSWTITTGGESIATSQDRKSGSRQTSGSVTPSIRGSTKRGMRVSLPFLDDSQAMTPTSEMLYNCDFHISDYIMAMRKLTAGSQADLPSAAPATTVLSSGVPSHAPPPLPSHDDSADTRSLMLGPAPVPPQGESGSNAHLAPWRLAALRRGSTSIDDEALASGPPDVVMENLRRQLSRSPQEGRRKLERRPPVDDAASILAIDVFSATPRHYQRIKIPMVDDSISKLGESMHASRLSVQSEQAVPTTVMVRLDQPRAEQQEVVIALEDDEESLPPEEVEEALLADPYCVVLIRRCWNSKAHRVFEMVVQDPFVDLFITLCIVVNTLFMALDHHGMSPTFEEHLRNGNYFFTAVFATECMLKILALSPCKYFADSWNVFDFFIVFLSLVELGLEGVQGLSVLRTFRLLRVFKLARSWPTLNLLIGIIGRTLGALGNLTFVLGIIVFIFAVMGMQLFGKSYRQHINRFPDGELPRWHFEDFTHSFMIVFRVLCGEWVESTWDCMVVYGWPCIPFFVLTLVVGNLVVLNLFLALLLDSFSSENIQSIMEEKLNEPNKLAEALDRFARAFNFLKVNLAKLFHIRLRDKRLDARTLQESIGVFAKHRRGAAIGQESMTNTTSELDPSHHELTPARHIPGSTPRHSSTPGHVVQINEQEGGSATVVAKSTTLPSIRPRATVAIIPQLARLRTISTTSTVEDCCPSCCYRKFKFINEWLERPSGIAFTEFRHKASRFVEHKYFETTVIVLILISSLALAIEDVNTRQNKSLVSVLEIMDKCFSVIFAAEMTLKWLALGFRRYFSDGWCWLDFVIVTVSIISWIAEGAGFGNLGAFRALRTLRALRPLRAVSRWEGMKLVVNALLQAIPSICNVFLVCVVFWLIFSIMGVQLFAGKFHKCIDEKGDRLLPDRIPNKTECLNQNFTWTNSKINFDNVGRAYLSLFQVATFSGWIEIIADAVDAVEVDQQPYREASVYFYFYFVLFIIFGSFFTLNLFIGVIIENFNKQKKRSGGSIEMFMTDEQKKYYNAMKKLKNKSPQKPIPKPKLWLHAKLFGLVTDQRFDVFIMVIIMLNMLQMCLEHHDQPPLFTTVLSYTNTVFVAIFTGEFVLKLIAFRHYYFTQPWNVFDCVVVVLSIIASALADYMADFPVSPTILRVVRVFRVGRVLRLVKSAKGIRTLLFSLAVSLPALFNIGLLLLLVIFIYACFGMSFFMNVRLTNGLNEQFNFQTIINSILLLFQLATSAGWDGVLLALLNDAPPYCNPTPTEYSPHGDCSNTTVAVIYLVSYIIISFMIVINMYIAVILENFGEATQDIQQGLTQDDFDAFFEKWERVDPTASQYIPISKLSEFVASLEAPLRIPMPNWRALVILDPPVCTDLRLHCDDVVTMLVRNAVAGSVSNAAETPELDLAAILSKEKPGYEITAYLSQLDTAARRIQRKWRRRRRLNIRRAAISLSRGNTLTISVEHESSIEMTTHHSVVDVEDADYTAVAGGELGAANNNATTAT